MMSEEETSSEKNEAQGCHSENWREVGDSFRALGESLVAAFRQTWENEEVRQQLQKGMDAFAEGINRAVKEAADSEHAKQIRAEMGKAAQSAQAASAQALRDAKPHIVASMRQLSLELQKMIDRLEKEERDKGTRDSHDGEA